jgi:hypothetical protein
MITFLECVENEHWSATKGAELEAIAHRTQTKETVHIRGHLENREDSGTPPPEIPEEGRYSPGTPTSDDKPDNPPAAARGGGEEYTRPRATTGEPAEVREAGERIHSRRADP